MAEKEGMIKITCPSCEVEFCMADEDQHNTCANPDCHVPYRFQVFGDKDEAAKFYSTVSSWKSKYLTQPAGVADQWVVAYFNDEIRPYRIRSLSSLIGREILRATQAGSADNLGGPITWIEVERLSDGQIQFERIEPLEYSGHAARPSHMQRFTEFCTQLRTASKNDLSGDRLCMEFDIDKAKEYIDNPPYAPKWHFCWCNLVDYIVPVVVHGQITGVVLGGQKRKDDPESNEKLKGCIEDIVPKLGLDVTEMTRLVFDEKDVHTVDEKSIRADLRSLENIAERLEKDAYEKYAAERQVREAHFLEEIETTLSEVARSSEVSELVLWDKAGQVLERILAFVGCFESIALLTESREGLGAFELVAASGAVANSFSALIPQDYFDELMPDRLGPLTVDPGTRPKLYKSFSEKLFPYEIAIGYVVRTRLRSGRHLLLVLAVPAHDCRYRDIQGFCGQRSPLALRFLAHLGNQLASTVDLLLLMQHLRSEDQRRKAFFVRAAHSLSLPIQSILVDSANLVEETVPDEPGYEMRSHLFNEVQGLQLVVENLLHAEARLGRRQRPEFYYRSLLDPLKEACTMFMGEAAEKGCDIRPTIAVNGIRVEMPPRELDDTFLFYLRALYQPVKERLGIPSSEIVWKDGIGPRVVIGDRELSVPPELLPKTCVEKRPDSIRISILNQETEADPDSIAKMYLPDVAMVYDELAQAFKNLVHNAVKYSYRTTLLGKKRYVQVSCEQVNSRSYRVSISNYGIGIMEHEIYQGLIWQEGYRGELSGDRNRWGAGLGLAHAKETIEEVHGGKLEAGSFWQHGGTYLTVLTATLPVSQKYRLG